MLVTDSEELAAAVEAELERQVAGDQAHRADPTRPSPGSQSGVVLVDDLDQGIAVVNAYAAEHLEIQTADAAGVAGRIRNAGAIFVGDYAPVSLGDYCAGSNHVLPTGGCALPLLGAEGGDVPARHAGRQLHPRRPGRGQRAHREPVRGGGPSGARRGGHSTVPAGRLTTTCSNYRLVIQLDLVVN